MDNFTEQIIKQSLTFKRVCVIIATVIGVLAVCAVSFLFFRILVFPFAALSGFAIYWVSSMQGREVEYEVTNGDIDIDVIIARRDRKKIVRVRGDKIESLLPISKAPSTKQFDRVVMAARSKNTVTWAFTYHSKKGSTIVLFEPNDKVLDMLCKGLDRIVRIETDRAKREL